MNVSLHSLSGTDRLANTIRSKGDLVTVDAGGVSRTLSNLPLACILNL